MLRQRGQYIMLSILSHEIRRGVCCVVCVYAYVSFNSLSRDQLLPTWTSLMKMSRVFQFSLTRSASAHTSFHTTRLLIFQFSLTRSVESCKNLYSLMEFFSQFSLTRSGHVQPHVIVISIQLSILSHEIRASWFPRTSLQLPHTFNSLSRDQLGKV